MTVALDRGTQSASKRHPTRYSNSWAIQKQFESAGDFAVRMYLSSFDVGAKPEQLVGLVGGQLRAAIVVNALDHREAARAQWLESQATKLRALGFTVQELDLRQFFGTTSRIGETLEQFDAVWVNGGNAFILRRAMKQSGFDVAIADLLARDRIVYSGFSAAVVIASSTLRALDHVSDPIEVPPGYDPAVVWDGLGILPFSLVVHFQSDHPESEAVGEEVAFYERHQMPYKTLKDGEVFVMDSTRSEIVGP
ncbi:Type 1 glutamine amidotransferase-like domain-containing protein [Paraburkholderia guartelaensis]|uniref:Type 1 glutamine amidotransferase-like domain-containing protein n=1 Tax=Paraburkholderia guartelaensis TaxID=2546446 RepID=UPI001FE56CCF|nr:Type 1 glutamine amidotransferase-like domain-containing protein [Paraburkholderia guartelaensis]